VVDGGPWRAHWRRTRAMTTSLTTTSTTTSSTTLPPEACEFECANGSVATTTGAPGCHDCPIACGMSCGSSRSYCLWSRCLPPSP
jgi:hypothetical protein